MLLSDFDTLESAKAYEQIGTRVATPDMVISMLSQYQSALSLKVMADTDDVAAGFLLALSGSVSNFNVITGHPVGDLQQASLSHLVSISAVTQGFLDAVMYYSNNYVTAPYSDTTLIQFNQAKGIYTEIEVASYNGQDLKVTLDSDADCTLTTWELTEFGYENFGKIGHVKTGNTLTKISTNNKKANGTLFVRVPLITSFTVELI